MHTNESNQHSVYLRKRVNRNKESIMENDNVHGEPPDGWECLVTMEDITIENNNYVEYQCYPSMRWKPSKMEQSVIEELLQTQFNNYINRVKETDCQAELRRLLLSGPPIYITDLHGLPINDDSKNSTEDTMKKSDTTINDNDDNINKNTNTITTNTNTQEEQDQQQDDTHICKLWFASDNTERSSKLVNAVEGIERQQLWDELKQFVIVEGKEQQDDE